MWHLPILAGVAVFTALVVAVITITLASIYKWFQSRHKITAEQGEVIGVTIADRLNGKPYVQVDGVFSGKPKLSQLVQVVYDKKGNKILDARGITSSDVEKEVVRLHDEGQGVVVYN